MWISTSNQAMAKAWLSLAPSADGWVRYFGRRFGGCISEMAGWYLKTGRFKLNERGMMISIIICKSDDSLISDGFNMFQLNFETNPSGGTRSRPRNYEASLGGSWSHYVRTSMVVCDMLNIDIIRLVVWNMFDLSIYWEFHHPN